MTIRIDPEFRDLIAPLRPDERSQLEANIVAEGVRDPLVVWQGILLDGHNRYDIATKFGLPYQTVEREFDSRDAVVLWIVYNQFGRRNLTTASRAELAMRIEPILAAQAKARQVAAGGDKVSERAVVPTLEQPLARDVNASKTATQAAEAAGLKRATYHKAKTVLTSAPAEIVAAFRAGDISTNQAYQHVKRGERRAEWQAEVAAQLAVTPSGAPVVDYANASEWLAALAPASVDLLLTDPPYSTDVEDIAAFAQDWLPKALRTLKPTGRAFVCVGAYPHELAAYMAVAMPTQILVWTYRNTIGPSPSHLYKLNWQAILYYAMPDAPPLECPQMVEQFSVQDINAPDGRIGDRYHAWQKPSELGERFVRHATQPGAVVIDPFTGTGTFLLAAATLGRIGKGCERDEAMIDTAIVRGCVRGE